MENQPGGHLAVITLLRLRDKHSLVPFCGANLVCGIYDLALTPSVRHWGDEKLILNTRDMEIFVEYFLPEGHKLADPDISPLHADLSGLPPAIFTIGTNDLLLDDSLFMASRWSAAGNTTDLGVYPGGAHVFIALSGKLAEEGNARIEAFMREC